MKLFRKDVPAAIERERAALAAATAKAADLQRQRGAMLIETDGFDRAWKADRDIAELNQRATVHAARIEALALEAVERDREQREAQRDAAIQVISQKLKDRDAAVAELDGACRRLVASFAAVISDRGIRSDWPFRSGAPSLRDEEVIARGVLCLIHNTARASGVDLFPREFLGPLNSHPVADLVGRVVDSDQRLIASLRAADIEPEINDEKSSEIAA